jgi:UDP-N-acetylglucosamine 2-epimerase (non-hydrolysing)
VLRVATVLGTRPEIIRLSRVIAAFDAALDHVLVHTGQNHDPALDQVFFDELGIREPDHRLEVAAATPAESIARVIAGVDAVLAAATPDAVLILGDTNSALAAIAAKRRRIPVFHMEAGNRCFDERVPEEVNRRIVDHVADVNLPYSAIARENLLREGLPPDRVIVTGSPMREVLEHYRPRIDAADALARLGLAEHGYFLVSAHREENVDDAYRLRALYDLTVALADRHRLPVVVSTHPRTRARMEALGLADTAGGGAVRFLRPFGFPDWIRLQLGARAVLSDSARASRGHRGGRTDAGRARCRPHRAGVAGARGAAARAGRLGAAGPRLPGPRRIAEGAADRGRVHRVCEPDGLAAAWVSLGESPDAGRTAGAAARHSR